MSEEITPRQAAMLRYIAKHIDEHGYQPSVREIGDKFQINSPNGVMYHLRTLADRGYVSLALGQARAIAFPWKKWR